MEQKSFCDISDLNELMGGMIQQRWEEAIGNLCENVLDPDTDPTEKRKITMVLTVKPTKDRDAGEMTFEVKESLAQPVPVSKMIYFGRDQGGRAYAEQMIDQIPGQVDMMGGMQSEPVRVELYKR